MGNGILSQFISDRIRLIILESGIALLISIWDPFNISAEQNKTIDRWIAVISQFFYESKGQGSLAVVLIDQDSLDELHRDWPLDYADIAAIGHRIACAGAIGIFFDFVPSRKYNLDEGADDLRALVKDPIGYRGGCRSDKARSPVPVFFARAPGIDTPLLADLNAAQRTFLIETEAEANIYAAGAEQFIDHVPAFNEITPAFGLFRYFCGEGRDPAVAGRLPCPPDVSPARARAPIYLTWNGHPASGQKIVADAANCADPSRYPLWDGIRLLFAPEGRRCGPLLTLRVTDLYRGLDFITTNRVNPASYLDGRIVLIGVHLAALKDDVISPVHDRLPGVYAHGMALDNLLTYGGRYYTVPPNRHLWFVAAIFFFCIHVVLEYFLKDSRSWIWRATGLGLIVVIFALVAGVVLILRWPFSLIVEWALYAVGTNFLVLAIRGATRVVNRRQAGGTP